MSQLCTRCTTTEKTVVDFFGPDISKLILSYIMDHIDLYDAADTQMRVVHRRFFYDIDHTVFNQGVMFHPVYQIIHKNIGFANESYKVELLKNYKC